MSVITKEMIFLNSKLKDKDEIIDFIVNQADEAGYVNNRKSLYESVQDREALASTAVGFGVAMPHGKTSAVKTPFIAFLRTSEPFRWSRQQEEDVRLIFLIGVPEEAKGEIHLKLISQLSKKLLDDEFRETLLTFEETDKIYDALSVINI